MCAHHAPLFPMIIAGPFTKWRVDFITCHPTSTRGHHYIIVAIDYFMKWVEAMPIIRNDIENATYFVFNHIITHFGV